MSTANRGTAAPVLAHCATRTALRTKEITE